MSLATWLLFADVPARCVVLCVRCCWPLGSCSPLCPRAVLCVRCPRPLGSCSSVCTLGLLRCVRGVLGHSAPVHRCARSLCCVCGVLGDGLLSTNVPALCVVLCVRCPLPLSSCSPVCPLGVLCSMCGVDGLLAPVHWCACGMCCVRAVLCHLASVHHCARSVCCVACAVSLATLLPFTGVLIWCAVCAASLATWLLFTGVPAWCVVLRVRCCWPLGSCSSVCLRIVLCARCPWPLCSCSLVCPLGVLCCVCGVLGHLAPVHRCARSVLCVCCVLGHVAPVRCCSRSVCCVLCAVSFATWLLFIGVPAQCVGLCVRCLLPPGSRSPVCPLAVLCCGFGVLGDLAPVDRVARSVCCVACAVYFATWILYTSVLLGWVLRGVLRHVVVLCVRYGSFVRPGCSRSLHSFGVVCVPWGGCGSLAPGPMPWLWLAARLSMRPPGPELLRRASSTPFALGAPIGCPIAPVPSAHRGLRAWIYWLAARGTWRPAENRARGACRWP